MHEGKEGVQLKELVAPSERTVVSLINPTNDSKRYDAASFYIGDPSQCTEKLVRRWRDALHAVCEDDIVAVGNGGVASSSSESEEDTPNSKLEDKQRLAKILHEDGQQLYVTRLCLLLLALITMFHRIRQIVLGRKPGDWKEYWPGRVISVEYKGRQQTKVHFLIQFWEEKRPRYLPRRFFYIEDDAEFFTCHVSRQSIQEWDHASVALLFSLLAQMGEAREVILKEEYTSRSPSPEPQLPLPDETSFADLPLRHQLGYVRNVLLAVIRD